MNAVTIASAGFRALHLMALLSLAGCGLFSCLIAPAELRLRFVRVMRVSAAFALLFLLLWLGAEAIAISGAERPMAALSAAGVVVRRTQFGQLVLTRFVLLVLAAALLYLRPGERMLVLLLAASALALQPMLGHAGAVGGGVGTFLIGSEALHVLAAAAWLGALIPLLIVLRTLPAGGAGAVLERFSPIGLCAVCVLMITAVIQAGQWSGGLPGLFGTDYGHLLLVKLALFLLALVLALLNRFWLTDWLVRSASAEVRRMLRITIGTETALGALVVIAAAFLASSAPGSHVTPSWPFTWRPNFDLLRDELAGQLVSRELAPSVLVALAAAVLAVAWRRQRVAALALLLVALVFALKRAIPWVTVPAYPTTFEQSPTEFSITAITRGADIFTQRCTECHGVEGRGDGPAARTSRRPAADLTAEHFWAHTEGDLFWFISHGFADDSGTVLMPGFADVLSTGARWQLVDFLRAQNAGANVYPGGAWKHPIQIPQFEAGCSRGVAINRDDLAGKMARFVITDDPANVPAAPDAIDLVTIIVSAKPEGGASSGNACVVREREGWRAFAILLGTSPEDLPGRQIVADANGWLRVQAPMSPADPDAFARMLRDIAAHPLPVNAGGGSAHRH